MTQPHSGISTRNLLVLGGLSALLATPAARARVLALLQGPLEGAQDLFKETVAPTAQQALSRAGELSVDARKAAVHAAAQVQDSLPGLIDGVRGGASSLAGTIAEGTAELRSDLGERAARAAAAAAKTAASVQGSLQERFEDVQESAGKRTQALLGSVADVQDDLKAEVKKAELGKKVGEFQASVQKKAHDLTDDAQEAAQDRLKDARKAVGLLGLGAAKAAEGVQEKVQKKVQVNVKEARQAARVAQKNVRKRALNFADNAQGEAQDRLKDARKSAGKLEARARKEAAEQAVKTKKHVAQTIDAAQVMTKKELKGFDKRSRVQLQAYQSRIARLESELARSGDKTLRKLARQKAPRSRGGTVFSLLLLIGGGVVLARVPAARQGILNGVGALSPEAETWLRNAGRSVRNLIGTAWLERLEEPGAPVAAAAAAPAPKEDQATGSAAYASVEPGSPAADPSPITKPN